MDRQLLDGIIANLMMIAVVLFVYFSDVSKNTTIGLMIVAAIVYVKITTRAKDRQIKILLDGYKKLVENREQNKTAAKQ